MSGVCSGPAGPCRTTRCRRRPPRPRAAGTRSSERALFGARGRSLATGGRIAPSMLLGAGPSGSTASASDNPHGASVDGGGRCAQRAGTSPEAQSHPATPREEARGRAAHLPGLGQGRQATRTSAAHRSPSGRPRGLNPHRRPQRSIEDHEGRDPTPTCPRLIRAQGASDGGRRPSGERLEGPPDRRLSWRTGRRSRRSRGEGTRSATREERPEGQTSSNRIWRSRASSAPRPRP
jgi:hypothetical protein